MAERKKKESQESENEKKAPEKNDGNHLNSVILFALGILSALLLRGLPAGELCTMF